MSDYNLPLITSARCASCKEMMICYGNGEGKQVCYSCLKDKQERVTAVIIEWKQKQGHDRCHYFPELFNRIAEILDLDVRETEDDLPPEEEFQHECDKFRKKLYSGK